MLYMVNSVRSKIIVCMGLLRELFWACFVNNVDIFASYISTDDNVLVDGLSQCNVSDKKLTVMQILFLMACVVLILIGRSFWG